MAWYAKLQGIKGSTKGEDDGTSDTFLFAEKFAVDTDQTPAGTRLFVGNLSMNVSDPAPEKGDEVLVVFENGHGTHPDFLWAPDGGLL